MSVATRLKGSVRATTMFRKLSVPVQASRGWKKAALIWLVLEILLLVGSLLINPLELNHEYNLLAGLLILLLAFPSSLLAMNLTSVVLRTFGIESIVLWNIVTWAGCFLAGVAQFAFVRMLLLRRRTQAQRQ
jgi:hypothetical protein